jgi:hypothetical protein
MTIRNDFHKSPEKYFTFVTRIRAGPSNGYRLTFALEWPREVRTNMSS